MVCCALRAATVAFKALQQSARAARSHAHARAGRAGAGRPSGNLAVGVLTLTAEWPSPQVRAIAASGVRAARKLQRRLLSWASCSLTWDGVIGALLAEAACSCLPLRPPARRGMQPVSLMMFLISACDRLGEYQYICCMPLRAEDLTACKAAAGCIPVRWWTTTMQWPPWPLHVGHGACGRHDFPRCLPQAVRSHTTMPVSNGAHMR